MRVCSQEGLDVMAGAASIRGSSKGTRRSTMIRRNAAQKSAFSVWLRRTGFSILFLTIIVLGFIFLSLSDSNSYIGKFLNEKFMKITSEMGYRVENIMLEGRNFTSPEAVREIVKLEQGDAIFRFDPIETKQKLEQISWVKAARVERRLPSTLYIRLEERVPFALWQREKDLVLIDDSGFVLDSKNLKQFENLMMFRGVGAPEHAKNLMQMLEAEPELKARADHAIWIENRRWDLVLKDKKVLKLPEKDIGFALANIIAQNKKEGILDKPLTTIDVRDPARLIVRTDLGKVQDYNASLNMPGENL